MEKRWSFRKIPEIMPHLKGRDQRDSLLKWGLKDSLWFSKFAFDEPVEPLQFPNLIKSFLSTSLGQATLCIKPPAKTSALASEAIPIGDVKLQPIGCTLTDLSVFDALEKTGVIRRDGSIEKCFGVPHPDFEITDRVRECLLCEDSELYESFGRMFFVFSLAHFLFSNFPADVRNEFLFHIFFRLVLGGQLCQYDDYIGPYRDMAKLIYKDLVAYARFLFVFCFSSFFLISFVFQSAAECRHREAGDSLESLSTCTFAVSSHFDGWVEHSCVCWSGSYSSAQRCLLFD
jgi:hypothetical protein